MTSSEAHSSEPRSSETRSSEPRSLEGRRASFAHPGSQYYAVLVALLTAFYLISNIAATKQMDFGGWVVDGGVFLFPLTYLLGGIISEVYGFRAAMRAVLVGFGVMVIGAAVFGLVTASPALGDTENQEAFEVLFGWDGIYLRILVASLAGFLVGQLMNSLVIVRVKRRFGESNLWARIMSSSVFGQSLDTAIFGIIAFSTVPTVLNVIPGVDLFPLMSWAEFGSYVVLGVVYKCLVEFILFPVTFTVVRVLKRREPSYRS
ncbi:queuosine precursor transporter [Nesterenkonia lacusekhoensis]|uniref:Probable queuosine precursor transporter n=1 Tax=Nesterenkonia lacusekhoensis TaxID=150832 RepID=A0ABS4T4P4_9MICC|nr:queuosine precursor transporter [Nesterenkonia lacusekhoensis]MBP2319431.1 putative integral membrane protein (TIGR00697 family) [Nesterenkonia lacusekhoensis]